MMDEGVAEALASKAGLMLMLSFCERREGRREERRGRGGKMRSSIQHSTEKPAGISPASP
jgi:hypothetical protein